MFESLFKHPRALARQQEGPAAEARQRLLSHCSAQGMARATLAAACPGSSRYRWPNRGYVWQSRHPAGDRRGGRLLDPRSDQTAPCSGSKLVAGSIYSNSERLAWLPAGFGEAGEYAGPLRRPDRGLCPLPELRSWRCLPFTRKRWLAH